MGLSWLQNFAAVALNCRVRAPKRKTAICLTAGRACITSPNKTAAGYTDGWQSGERTSVANGRNKGSKGDSGRDPGGFVALPWQVLDCPAYARLSMHARALLLEVARQFVRDNNGRMLLSRAYMAKRGWKSVDMLTKAKLELLEGGFIFQTVMGHRPNKASWYAVTWRTLDKLPGYDAGTEKCFERGAYRNGQPLKNAGLRPSHGTGKAAIVPPHGTETAPTVPPHGAISPTFEARSVPPHGHHLETPSPGIGCPVH